MAPAPRAELREAQRLLALRRMGIWLRDLGLAPTDDHELARLATEAVTIVEGTKVDAVVWRNAAARAED